MTTAMASDYKVMQDAAKKYDNKKLLSPFSRMGGDFVGVIVKDRFVLVGIYIPHLL